MGVGASYICLMYRTAHCTLPDSQLCTIIPVPEKVVQDIYVTLARLAILHFPRVSQKPIRPAQGLNDFEAQKGRLTRLSSISIQRGFASDIMSIHWRTMTPHAQIDAEERRSALHIPSDWCYCREVQSVELDLNSALRGRVKSTARLPRGYHYKAYGIKNGHVSSSSLKSTCLSELLLW